MAKRKRLEVPSASETPLLETQTAYPPSARMPIADVAGETATQAALEEVSRAMTQAEVEGRMVRKLGLDQIETGHLSRDRMLLDPDEMAVLKTSLAARGQQTPIEVLRLSSGRYGLISGLRRVRALRDLGASEVLALIRQPKTAAASYVAMVEENEVRAVLSFYERANIAVQAVEAGVYDNVQVAVKGLFASVAAAKRSKILRFVVVRQKLEGCLTFPTAIPEKLGLALAASLEADKAVAVRIKDALRKTPPTEAAAERRVLERALKAPPAPSARNEEIAPGITLRVGKGKVTLSGTSVDAALARDLRAWLAAR